MTRRGEGVCARILICLSVRVFSLDFEPQAEFPYNLDNIDINQKKYDDFLGFKPENNLLDTFSLTFG